MVHTKIYKNVTLGQILMIMMVANIMLSLFVISVMLFGRDNPTKINQQINASSEMNKRLNAATLKAQTESEKRLEQFFTDTNHDNHVIIAKLDKSTTTILNTLNRINASITTSVGINSTGNAGNGTAR